ncbi:hypothetical protein Tsubulata_016439 [Turnera subulata]|uniref:Zinc knuckle CX2CX4HX4C domain-containing protein n=1 Tax=Turnera subulata TaxID=218843 RepID=A0A9Q0F335_9ROSI|nr:hypothetical protein Tsubulata_016439 [Turnera subulata]
MAAANYPKSVIDPGISWVDIETDRPLILRVTCLDENGKKYWVRFQYERLGEICCWCDSTTHPTSRCLKLCRPDEGIEKRTDDNYGPWMQAKEIFGKHYPDGIHRDFSHEIGVSLGEANRKKRKAVEEHIVSPIDESAHRAHTGVMNTVAELIIDLHDATPIHTSSSKHGWKRLARKAKVTYQPTTVDLIQAFEMVERGIV